MPNITEQAVYVIDGKRTPFLKAKGEPGPFSAADLAVACGRSLLLQQPFNTSELDEVILGCVSPAADEANIARVTALRLGCGEKVSAWTVQRNCGSGMQAVDSARQSIAYGNANLILAGGTEAMSHAPLLFNDVMVKWLTAWYSTRVWSARLQLITKLRPQHLVPVISLLRGLRDPVVGLSMGQTAEILSWRFNLDRKSLDQYAFESHQRAVSARSNKQYDEITPIIDRQGNIYAEDEGVREDSTLEKLGSLKPVFDKPYGIVTAANSAQVTDGAACLLLASEQAVTQYKLPVLGRLIDSNWAALDPVGMGLGPVYASTPLLQKHKLTLKDIQYWEINEAFSAQVLACLAAWKDDTFCKTELGLTKASGSIAPENLNVDGGAIALGHPVGASGARIILHLLKVLENKNASKGVATLCIGGGQGGAVLVEREVA